MSTPFFQRMIFAVSFRTTSSWRGSFPDSSAIAIARGLGRTSGRCTMRPSLFDTIFCATASTSPSRSVSPCVLIAPAMSAARSSPGWISGSPSSDVTVSERTMLYMLTLGWKASAEQFGPHDFLRYGALAEELGFESAIVSDHFHPWRDTGGHAPFSFAWLGALGASTSRIQMGTSVVTPTFRYHPAIVAQASATLAMLFPKRFFLGVGSGESMNETPVTAGEWPEPGERVRRLREAVRLMKKLWNEDYVSFEGKYFKTREAKIFDKPAGGVPLYIAGAGPQVAEFAGKEADGFICTSGKGAELYRDTLLPALDKGARDAGRDLSKIERM